MYNDTGNGQASEARVEHIIDVHMHVGHRFEWTERAQAVWMDTGPYVPRLFDNEERQLAKATAT